MVISPAPSNVEKKSIVNAKNMRMDSPPTEEGSMGANPDANDLATMNATIQPASDNSSRTTPRIKLSKTDTASTAITQ
jgi:hypothetical protein